MPARRTLFAAPNAARLIAAASAGALAFVLVMQYGFGLTPCILCQWQRLPFILTFLLSLFALSWRPYSRQAVWLLHLCGLIFLAGAALAFYHSGVERHWWAGTSSCAPQAFITGSAEDLRNQLLQTPVARCDRIVWSLLGLSMANLNIGLSLALALFALRAANPHRFKI